MVATIKRDKLTNKKLVKTRARNKKTTEAFLKIRYHKENVRRKSVDLIIILQIK